MRLATIVTASGPHAHVRGRSGYVDIAEGTGDSRFRSMTSLLEAGPVAMDAVRKLVDRDGTEYGPEDLGPAVPRPGRILCLGLNYREHALEGGREVPAWPESFVRCPGTVIGPFADLVKPALTERFDFEGELGIVMGEGGRYIPAEKALSAIAGYVVLNDASARDWQRAGTQWTGGKNFDGTLPIGPELVTADEVDVSDLALTTRVNDHVMQSARTSQMIVSIPSTVEFFSSFTRLLPGDVIATGTPGGVGFARQPPVWLVPGDVVEVAVEGLGSIRNRVVAEEDGVVAEEDGVAHWRWSPLRSTP
ncbi:MAG: fumarylacetoacetate hydrolase family protein [Acidimicrobiales bacterium]